MKNPCIIICMTALLTMSASIVSPAQNKNNRAVKPEVYMLKEIKPDNLIRIYKALGRKAKGKVAVKISTGEPGDTYYLDPGLIKNLVRFVKGTLVECNTAYGGGRATTEGNRKAADEHGFTAIAPVDIMDADGEISLPVRGGKHLKEDFVGSHLKNYDFVIVLSHFKGHAMAGFGGAIKNISIGIASASGKAWIHSGGKVRSNPWKHLAAQDDFLESMAEAAKAVANYEGKKILYINIMNNLSVDCDCDSHPAAPEMNNVGILASLDPVALDQACVDRVMNSKDPGNKALKERITSRHGTHTLDYGEQIGLGKRNYTLIELTGNE